MDLNFLNKNNNNHNHKFNGFCHNWNLPSKLLFIREKRELLLPWIFSIIVIIIFKIFLLMFYKSMQFNRFDLSLVSSLVLVGSYWWLWKDIIYTKFIPLGASSGLLNMRSVLMRLLMRYILMRLVLMKLRLESTKTREMRY